jgi:glutamate dehydrogenase
VTVIRAEVGDRPFIVDTIREYLSAENISIHHYIYPVLHVVRDAEGRTVGIGATEGARPEALVHCEVSRIQDPQRQEALCREIQARLRDVVAATDDFDHMLGALEETRRRARS